MKETPRLAPGSDAREIGWFAPACFAMAKARRDPVCDAMGKELHGRAFCVMEKECRAPEFVVMVKAPLGQECAMAKARRALV